MTKASPTASPIAPASSPLPSATPGFGVYVHWPFCLAKCPYCDFNSHVRAAVDQSRYIDAFRREIAAMAALAPGRQVSSIFLGGGTPSLMDPVTVAAILDAIGGAWQVTPGAEVTLEANPTSVEAGRFRGYRAAGVNRVSLGVQAMNDADLKRLGRMHSVDEAMAAVEIAARHFERFSFDIIYARPDQQPEDWKSELNAAIDRAAEHLSLYQLTIEPDTMYERLVAAGKLVPMPDGQARVLFDITREICDRRGLPAYEISNHARPGAECRHNLVYWRYGEYAGIGPGAHGRLIDRQGARRALSNIRHPENWLESVGRCGTALADNQILTPGEQGDEMLLMGLRLREGIDLDRFASLRGRPADMAAVSTLVQDGLIETVGPCVRVTRAGVPLLDSIIVKLSG